MLFVIIAKDKPGHLETRLATRDSHIAYIKGVGDRLKLAGPLLSDDDEGKMIGSILLIDADSLKAAQLFAENDPYASAGLFETVEIKPWKAVLGVWKGE